MTDDLVKRLRAVLWSVNGEPNANGNVDETACSEAADLIEQLTAERDRLREALRHIVTYLAEPTVASEDTLNSLRGDLRFVGRVASAALKGDSHE